MQHILKWLGNSKQRFFLLSGFWLLVASFKLLQDSIDASLHHNSLQWGESLIFKSFWLLFIPLSWLLIRLSRKIQDSSKIMNVSLQVASVLTACLVHLLLFSLVLAAYSHLFHTNPWSFQQLIVLKLSTRLYIALSVYTFIIAVDWFAEKRTTDIASAERNYQQKLTVKFGTKVLLLHTTDIDCIRSDGTYLSIVTGDRTYPYDDSLKGITEKLDPKQFKRIHRSTIVNMQHIKSFKSRKNGDYDVLLNNGMLLRMSRNYAKAVKSAW